MDNPFDAMRQAVRDARALNEAVDSQTNALADLLDGRLMHVSSYRLKKLKAQLRLFNSHTGKWKDPT